LRLHLHEWGDPDAPPVVCLHGVSGHGRRFRRLAEEFLASRYRVLAPDLRGHGRSGWDPPWNLAAHVNDVIETVKAAGIDRAIWIGHSFGGRLILDLFDSEPGSIEAAVLLDPAIQIRGAKALELAEAERQEKAFETVEEAIAKRIEAAPLLHTPRAALEEEMREHLVRSDDGLLRYRYSQAAVVAMYAELASRPPRAPERVPVLVVVGAESGLVTAAQLADLRAALGDAIRVATVPGEHIVLWDAYDETAGAVDRFLNEVEALPPRMPR
jgi:lipase